MPIFQRLLVLSILLTSVGCNGNLEVTGAPTTGPAVPTRNKQPATATPVQVATISPSHEAFQPLTTPTVTGTDLPAKLEVNTPQPTLAPDTWTSLPVVPEVSPRVKEIYQRGLELGNNPRAFSKVGDCGSTPAWFLGDFDRGPRYYNLGDYQSLEEVIQEFQGSFARTSLAAKSGFNASSVFAPLWANRKFCEPDESPLACEYRLHRPAFAFITLGTNDVWHMETFEAQMRRIIEFSIESGVVPILATKADNEEGDGSVNATIADLAHEYGIPLWNYWLAVQPLPDHGLQDDAAHITWGPNRFYDPKAMEKGWPVRNLTALQVLDKVWQAVSKP
jgi:hypothetical protein